MNTCTACHRLLTGGIDTFGPSDIPMCWECHSSCMFDGDPPQMIDAAIFAADAEVGHTRHCASCGRFLAETDYLPDDDQFDEKLALECGYSQELIDNHAFDLDSPLIWFRYITKVWECVSCDVWYQFDTTRYYWNPEVGTYTSERPMTLREQAERHWATNGGGQRVAAKMAELGITWAAVADKMQPDTVLARMSDTTLTEAEFTQRLIDLAAVMNAPAEPKKPVYGAGNGGGSH